MSCVAKSRVESSKHELDHQELNHYTLKITPNLLVVGLVPEGVLHHPLVGAQPRVCGRHALLHLVEGGGKVGEEVVLLGLLPNRLDLKNQMSHVLLYSFCS